MRFQASCPRSFCLTVSKMTMILTLGEPSVMMVRDRRGGYESSDCTGLTAVMTAISAVHRKDARALFRFRKSAAAGRHDLFGNVKMPAAFGPTRQRTRAKSRGRPIRTYVGTRRPAWQPPPINWCHGLTDESENCRLVGLHHSEAERWRRSQNRHFCPLVAPIL